VCIFTTTTILLYKHTKIRGKNEIRINNYTMNEQTTFKILSGEKMEEEKP